MRKRTPTIKKRLSTGEIAMEWPKSTPKL